ncbi:MAG: hypothetical protein DI535_03600 [Citrobacter freundii]|nr:MAG: hypothetical protein DI535_03600 [Citrobacter freundii]
MKIFKFISHPIVVSFTFFMILISGDHFGGFYLLYILMALPYGALHAILGFLGVTILVVNSAWHKIGLKHTSSAITNILGIFVLYVSLVSFFRLSWDENDNTFVQTIPLISFFLFVLCSVSSLVSSVLEVSRAQSISK